MKQKNISVPCNVLENHGDNAFPEKLDRQLLVTRRHLFQKLGCTFLFITGVTSIPLLVSAASEQESTDAAARVKKPKDRFYGGWLRDYPDIDNTPATDSLSPSQVEAGETKSVKEMLRTLKVSEPGALALSATVDLRPWCSPIVNQNKLGSTTACAGVGLMEYFERRAFGKYLQASRLFLYKTTRNLLGWEGDTGAYLRTTMEAMVLFGVPPEQYWPYKIQDFDKEPSAFCYSFAQNYQAIQYYRLDPPGTSPDGLLQQIKTNLAAGLPSMFGFTVYNSYAQAATTGKFPFPTAGEKVVGGQALVAVGYDDTMKIKNTNPGATETTGALLIRNSWGKAWGEAGYGWLPYEYVLKALAVDWWTLIKSEWVDTGQFG